MIDVMAKDANKDGLQSHRVEQSSTGSVCEIDGHSHARSHTDVPNASQRPDRQADGRFARGTRVGRKTRFRKGNGHAITHGLRARQGVQVSPHESELAGQDLLPRSFEFLNAELQSFLQECIRDEGGDISAVPRRRRSLLELRARIQRRALQLDTALEVHGLVDRRGKLRVHWLQRLEGLVNTAKALDSALGLERRREPIPTVDEFLNRVDHSQGRSNGGGR